MKVKVKWNISPRRFGIPRSAGTFSLLDAKFAKELIEKHPGIFEEIEREKPIKVKDTKAKKTYTRPVER